MQSVQKDSKVSTHCSGKYLDWDKYRSKDVKLYVEGVHCTGCVGLLERLSIVQPAEVEQSTFNLPQSTLRLRLRPGAALSRIAGQIEEWGYVPHLIEEESDADRQAARENRARLIDIGVAGALAGNIMLMSIPLYSGVDGSLRTFFEALSLGLAVPAVFYSGRSFFKNVAAAWVNSTFSIDAPILLAILVAFFYSCVSVFRGTHELYFDSLSALIFLLLSSRYYLARLRRSSKLSLGVLDYFQAKGDRVVGDRYQPESGMKLSSDGVLRFGQIAVDFSHFSGESVPVWIKPGGEVYAGTQIIEASGDAVIEVTAVGDRTRMAQMLEKVREAQERRSDTQIQADRWAKSLLRAVTTVAFASLVYFAWRGHTAEGIRRVLALLIVTCPCALALATPLVFSRALQILIRQGLLVKDPIALDRGANVRKIFFDKTGTLTWGKLSVVGGLESADSETLRLLYSMVTRSRHPVSRAIEAAIVRIAEKDDRSPVRNPESWTEFREMPGLGLSAFRDGGEEFRLVRSEDNQTTFSEVVFQKGAVREELLRVRLQDQLRPKSAKIIRDLQINRYGTALVTGDHAWPAREVANQTGINFVYSQKTPEEKAEIVERGLMVGDGLNDALALSKARVSIAVQGGIDAAIQSAQVYSLKPGIETVPVFLSMSKLVRRTLKQNFIYSTAYNLIGATLSLSGFMSPLLAAVLMPMSATTVFVWTLARLREKNA
ncbi:MAG: cation-translocating P-type ATPase [Bdellovibrionales bacterium]|nr:cation-translocating P-type ATPase [Bdellovibrionales bacterium]